MAAPAKILELVQRFEDNADDYRAAQYNEANVRQEFINPFFECLGWDIDNRQRASEKFKDVIHEAAIKVGGATKAPDYCFRFGGTPVFFLEAKRWPVSCRCTHSTVLLQCRDCGPDFRLVVPGIRPVGAAASDQKRVMSPAAAAAAGASDVVVGRPITAAADPAAAAALIRGELASRG